MTQINRKSTAFLAVFLVLVTGLFIQSHALTQQTVLSVTTSTANTDSCNCRYDLLVGAERTGETTAYVEYTLNARLTSGSDSHTAITATIYLGGSSVARTLKNASDTWSGTTTHPFTGSANITVNPKDTSLYTALAVSGSGSYKTKRTEKYTAYKTEYYYVDEKNTEYSRFTYTATSWGVYRKNHTGDDNVLKTQYHSYCFITAKSQVPSGWKWSKILSYPDQTSNTATTGRAEDKKTTTTSVKHSKQVPYQDTRTVYDTHKTNTGTLGATAGTRPAIEAWYYVKYDANGGQDAPETHGFIGGNSTTISTKQPRYYIASIKKDGYNFIGWKSVGVIRNSELL